MDAKWTQEQPKEPGLYWVCQEGQKVPGLIVVGAILDFPSGFTYGTLLPYVKAYQPEYYLGPVAVPAPPVAEGEQ